MSTFLDAAWATDKTKPLEHQNKAWAYAWGVLSTEQQAEFLKKFRNFSDSTEKFNNPLIVQYMSQRDNYRDASRTCFSSSCAMMLKFLKPTSIKNDDDYIRTVFTFGDSTDSNAQLAALKHYGIAARFTTQGSRDLIKKQIDSGKPVPCGFLHHGNVKNPQGGGHYLCIIGYNSEGYWVHDPWGDCNLTYGTYDSTNGKKLHYSYKNFEPRWLVEGPKSGWCIIA
jgi:uncharacterized protein YvpB